MIDLDPSIVDQESLRKKRRKKLLLVSGAPVILLLLAGLFFLRPGIFDVLYSFQFNGSDGNASGLISLSQIHKNLNLIESYIAYYDAGTAYIVGDDGVKAEEELRESIRHNPPMDKICMVRVNLSYSIEMQADKAREAHNNDEALVLYNKAEGVLYEDNCASKQSSNPGQDENADKAKERISQKKSMSVSEINNSGSSDGGNNQNGREADEESVNNVKGKILNGESVQNAINNSIYKRKALSPIEHW